MPLADVQARNKYAREYAAKRRAEWFADKFCVDCKTKKDLELDHIDPKEKVSHRIWSWSWERIAIETAKCVVRCTPCHREKSLNNGDNDSRAKINLDIAEKIRLEYKKGQTQKALADKYGLRQQTVSKIVRNKIWVV